MCFPTLGELLRGLRLQIRGWRVNSLRPRPNRRHFADDIFKRIFENENEWISPRISLKFGPKVQFSNIPALVQITAWRRPGDKPFSEPMMVSSLTHICVTWPQWVNGQAMARQCNLCQKLDDASSIRSHHLISDTKIALARVAFYYPRKWDTTKTHFWELTRCR